MDAIGPFFYRFVLKLNEHIYDRFNETFPKAESVGVGPFFTNRFLSLGIFVNKKVGIR
jgi:hypothetical protein